MNTNHTENGFLDRMIRLREGNSGVTGQQQEDHENVGGNEKLGVGMNRGDRLQSDRGHGLHIDWGVCPGKMSYQWNRNNDLLIWRKAVDLR
jgi:hypothetical protein